MLDNVGLRYSHRASGAKAPRTLRPLPLLRFAVSATGGAHLCSNQYYLRFWLGICRTSLAVSALRIMRYCPKYRRPARASPGLWCAGGLFVCRRTAKNGIFCKFFARQRGQLLPRGGFYTIINKLFVSTTCAKYRGKSAAPPGNRGLECAALTERGS